MLTSTDDLLQIVSKVAYGDIIDPIQRKPYEDIWTTDEIDLWGSEWDTDDFTDEDFERPSFRKAFTAEKHSQVQEGVGMGVDAWALSQVQPDKQATFNSERWMRKYDNGYIPAEALDPIGEYHSMRPDAAVAFKAMNRAFKKHFKKDIGVTDSYRDFAAQVRLKAEKPTLAATPGKSNHGWGIALDLVLPEGSAEYLWFTQHADEFGFDQPMSWEPWHWEFHGGGNFKVKTNAYRKPAGKRRYIPVQERPQGIGTTIQHLYDPVQVSSMSVLPSAMVNLFTGSDERMRVPQGREKGKRPTAGTGKVPTFVPGNLRKHFVSAAKETGLSVKLLAVVGQVESGYAEDVMYGKRDSSAGAIGVMQVMSFNAGGVDLTKPKENIHQGARILAAYLERAKGDLRLALAAYNGGFGNPQFDYADMVLDRLRNL